MRHRPRGTDHAARELSALRDQAEYHSGHNESDHTAAHVFLADPDYRGIDVEAERLHGI
jgi:hypothetical protein